MSEISIQSRDNFYKIYDLNGDKAITSEEIIKAAPTSIATLAARISGILPEENKKEFLLDAEKVGIKITKINPDTFVDLTETPIKIAYKDGSLEIVRQLLDNTIESRTIELGENKVRYLKSANFSDFHSGYLMHGNYGVYDSKKYFEETLELSTRAIPVFKTIVPYTIVPGGIIKQNYYFSLPGQRHNTNSKQSKNFPRE